jgi:hypothetical protein
VLASLKTALGGSLSASVATGLAVAASATAIATGPAGHADWLKPLSFPPKAAPVTRSHARPVARTAPADRDPISVARDNQQPPGKAKGKAHGRERANTNATAHHHTAHGGGKPASPGRSDTSHAGGNGAAHVGGNGKSNGHG